MRALLDTCVISELTRDATDPCVRQRVADLDPRNVFVSTISLGEIALGVELLPEGRKRAHLERFLQHLEHAYGERILSVGPGTARTWGRVAARGRKRGRPVSTADGLIAATALEHGLSVWTRNASDFKPTGVEVVNPWTDAGAG